MRIFAIKNKYHKSRPAEAWLLYNEDAKDFTISISQNANPLNLPFIPAEFCEKGVYEIGPKWGMLFVRDRIVPAERQNIGQVLMANNLKEYDEFSLLMLNKGKCCQDDFYLEEVSEITSQSNSIADMIVRARKNAGMTQNQLSKASGLPQSNISRIENGNCVPSIETLEQLAKGMGKTLEVKIV